MASTESCVTIHMVASLDGFVARKDGRVDWLETSDEFEDGRNLSTTMGHSTGLIREQCPVW